VKRQAWQQEPYARDAGAARRRKDIHRLFTLREILPFGGCAGP
jgi:hypothetical protein